MNNKLFILFLIFTLNLFSKEINEHKIDLFFGNGIQTNYYEAVATGNDLLLKFINKNKAMKNSIIDETILNTNNIKANISYNHSFGIVNDLIECVNQKTDFEFNNFNEILNSKVDLLKIINDSEVFTDEEKVFLSGLDFNDAILDTVYSFDLLKQVEDYKNSINRGNRVMLIAHSQGTLFGNDSYNRLDSWQKEYFDMYGIGAAASQILGNYDKTTTNYLSLDKDPLAGIDFIEVGYFFLSFPGINLTGLKDYLISLQEETQTEGINIGLSDNHSISETNKNIYNIGLEDSDLFSGHYIKNYLQVPNLRNIIFDKIEDKINSLLKVSSQYTTDYNNPCQENIYQHKYISDLSFNGLSFYNNSLVNSLNEKVYENYSKIKNIEELINDNNFCYSANNGLYKISKTEELYELEDLELEVYDNDGYSSIKGKILNYNPLLKYSGFIYKNNEIENIVFQILDSEGSFSSSFKQNIDGNFKFYIKANYKELETQSEKFDVIFTNIKFNDVLNISFSMSENNTDISAGSISANFYDENHVGEYHLILKSYDNDLKVYQIDYFNDSDIPNEVFTTESSYTFTNLEHKKYKVEVWKTNKYGEKVKLSRNTEIDFTPGHLLKNNLQIDFNYRNSGAGNNYTAIIKIKEPNQNHTYSFIDLNTNTSGYFDNVDDNIQHSLNAHSTRNYFYNGEIARAKVLVKDSDGNLLDIFTFEKQLNKEIEQITTPFLRRVVNCYDPDNSRFKIEDPGLNHATSREFIINNEKISDSYENKPYVMNYVQTPYQYNLLQIDNIKLIGKNYHLNKEKEFNIPNNFDGDTTACDSSISARFKYNRQYNEEGTMTGWIVNSYYGNSSTYVTPGKAEYYVNGNLVKTLSREQLKNNTPFSLPMNYIDNIGTLKLVLYNVYGKSVAKTYNYGPYSK